MAGYLGAIPVPQATQHRESFTATSGQTTFATAGYTVGFLDVYLNGSHLSPADFTATNGSDVVLASGASTGDVCDIISYTAFEIADQTFTGTTTLTGNLLLGDNDKAIFGAGSDLQIYHDGSNSYIDDAGVGDLRIRGENLQLADLANKNYVTCVSDGAVALRFNDAQKLATTNTGIDVTGAITADGLTVDGDAKISSTSPTLRITETDTTNVNTRITAGGGSLYIQTENDAENSRTDRFRIDHSTGDISFYEDTGSTVKFFWDASAESLGIGTSSPSAGLQIQGADGSINGTIMITSTSVASAGMACDANGLNFGADTGGFVFKTGATAADPTDTGTERMRIDASGFIDMGPQSLSGVGRLNVSANPDNNYLAQWWNTSGATVGHIVVSGGGSATTYATSSDYRLKTDAQPMTGASDRVLALNPVNFEWVSDGTRVDGFLAHEAQAVVPECVTGTKDAMMDEKYEVSAATGDIYTPATDAYVDKDGNDVDAIEEIIHSADVEQPETLADGQQWRETTAAVMGTRSVPDMQGIDQSKLVPLLVASLQEALARITALENA